MKQMDRRLFILMRLRKERAVRAADIAAEIGCSVRTIYRDIDALCDSGVPVAAMPGEGYRLAPGYHLPPIAFSVEEAVQLLLGADLAHPVGASEERAANRAAVAKVEAALRPDTKREVDRLRERVRTWSAFNREPSGWLPVLRKAVTTDRLLYLRYHSYSPDAVTERKVEPYQLVYYDNDWHLVAYCRLREAMRDFRASRILDAQALDETFKRHPGIAAQAEPGDDDRLVEVRVFVESGMVPWVRENPGFGLDREEAVKGGSIFTYRVRDIRRLMPWLLSRGAAARVLGPPDVVRLLEREARAMADHYSETATADFPRR
jgi:predicted DNA-binding transcriptional regulator YafY